MHLWYSREVYSIKQIIAISTTGSPRSRYEHRRASALLHNIQNIRICIGKKKPIVSVTVNEKDFNKKQLVLFYMRVTSLLCGPPADLWPFYGFLCKRFSLCISTKNSVLNDKHPRFWHLRFGWCDRRDPMASNLHITRNYRECRKETNVWRKN